MQIQRIQSLMLLIAAILVAVNCFIPYGVTSGEAPASIYVTDAPALLVLNIATALLLIITIFMFRDLRRQMRLTILSMVLIAASAVTALLVLTQAYEGASPLISGGLCLLLVAFICSWRAYRGMKHDKQLLASADRIR